MRITKRQLRRIIKEEKQRLLSEQPQHQMYDEDDDLRVLGAALSEMVAVSTQMETLMHDMGYRYGELTALGTSARTIQKLVRELAVAYTSKLDDILRFR